MKIHITNLSALIVGLCLIFSAKADALTVKILNRTPFNLQGAIVRFFDSREYFSIPGTLHDDKWHFHLTEKLLDHDFEDSFFTPSLLITLPDYTELCYFGGIDTDYSLTITYNHCDEKNKNCVITCVGATDDVADGKTEDRAEISYDKLASFI